MDILTVIQLSLLVIPSVFALGFWRGRRRRTALEHQGEALVRRTLTHQFSQAGYHLLNHLTLPCQDGTTEIDHVLVARTGIFVIEAKHYSGTIEAWGDGPSWTQHLGPYTYQFQNPLRQNYKHVKAIEQVLDFVPTAHIHSLVVFTGTATFATGLPPQVYTLQGLVDHLAHQTHQVLTMQDLHLCVGRLECQRYRLSRQTDVEHHAYLARKFGHLS
jgi:hypothetical protein